MSVFVFFYPSVTGGGGEGSVQLSLCPFLPFSLKRRWVLQYLSTVCLRLFLPVCFSVSFFNPPVCVSFFYPSVFLCLFSIRLSVCPFSTRLSQSFSTRLCLCVLGGVGSVRLSVCPFSTRLFFCVFFQSACRCVLFLPVCLSLFLLDCVSVCWGGGGGFCSSVCVSFFYPSVFLCLFSIRLSVCPFSTRLSQSFSTRLCLCVLGGGGGGVLFVCLCVLFLPVCLSLFVTDCVCVGGGGVKGGLFVCLCVLFYLSV